MDPRLFLYFFSPIAGLFMVISGIYLIAKQKIYLDRESNQPIEIELPAVGKFKTNYPALGLFILGFGGMVFPTLRVEPSPTITVERVSIGGLVEASKYPVLVYAVRVQDSLTRGGEFHLPVPFLAPRGEDDGYRVLLVVNGRVIAEQRAVYDDATDGKIRMKFPPVVFEESTYEPNIGPIPDRYR